MKKHSKAARLEAKAHVTSQPPRPSAGQSLQEARRALGEVIQELETYREETRVQTDQLVKAQALLEKSRDRYADLFDFAPMPYLVLDRWGVIVEANLPSAALLQHERSRMVGFPLRRFVEPRDRQAILNHMRRCRKEVGRVTSELRLTTRGGHVVPVEVTSRRALNRGENGEAYPTAIADLTERDRAVALRNELLQQLVAAEESERRRMSREVHDVIGQHITALILGLRELSNSVDENGAKPKADLLLQIANQLNQDAHRLALNLRPTALDDLGLESALAGYIDDWSARTGIRVQYHSDLRRGRLTPLLETMFYRVAQEALTNVVRHANARQVNILLKTTATEASMIVEDDGCGVDPNGVFEAAAQRNRLGLRGMRERVQVSGGTLEIESAPEKGTALFIRVPLPGAAVEGAEP